jgi:hypothetical protein
MPLPLRILATASFATLVGLAVLTVRAATSNNSSAEQFRPIKEAEMPEGFPGYTPVGQIEIKDYPAYRKASASGSSGFWTLFLHIKQNNVAMTAPIEMNYGNPRLPNSNQLSMSFLYQRPDQGTVGTQGSVEVEDVPGMTVVSIGCRGARTTAAVNAAREKLVSWLDQRKGEYVAAGPMRIMGHNSPFVPRDKNFFEVQIPVKATESD